MAATSGGLARKIFVVGVFSVGCLALLLFCAKLVEAEPMEASWYGPGFEGNLTANGEVYDSSEYTAAHKTLAFGTRLIVSYEGRSLVVRINDRGPYVAGRDLDLSQGAAEYLGLTAVGVAVVDVETADASTPVGPYAPVGARAAAAGPQPANAEASDSGGGGGSGGGENQSQPAGAEEVGGAAAGAAAQQDQYAAADQYVTESGASEDQYQENEQSPALENPEPAPPAPKPAVPVLPPEPEPEALLAPPEELAVPNSTVVRRVELEVAAPPEPKPAPEPEVVEPKEEPEVVEPAEPKKEPEKDEPEITVLPDTGGVSPVLLVAGALLVGAGLTLRLLRA